MEHIDVLTMAKDWLLENVMTAEKAFVETVFTSIRLAVKGLELFFTCVQAV